METEDKLSIRDCKRIYTIIEKWFRLHNFVNTLDYPWTNCRYMSEYGVLYHWPKGSPKRYREATTKVLDDEKTNQYHVIEGDFISCSSFADMIIDYYIEDIFYGEITIDAAEQAVDEISKLFFDKFKDMQHTDERYYKDFNVPIEPDHRSWEGVEYYMDESVYEYVLRETSSSRGISMENVAYEQGYCPWSLERWLNYFEHMHKWLSRTNQFLKACQTNFQDKSIEYYLCIVRKLINLNNFIISLDVPGNQGQVNMRACSISYEGQVFNLGSFYDQQYVNQRIYKLIIDKESRFDIEQEVEALFQLYQNKYFDAPHYEISSDDEQYITCSPIEYSKLCISMHLCHACADAEYENSSRSNWKSTEWTDMFKINLKLSQFMEELEAYEKSLEHEEMNENQV